VPHKIKSDSCEKQYRTPNIEKLERIDMKTLIILAFLTFIGFATAWTFFKLGQIIGFIRAKLGSSETPST